MTEQDQELEDAAEEAKEEVATKTEIKKKAPVKKAKPCCEETESDSAAFLELTNQLEAAGVCTRCNGDGSKK
jgi:hypothetical protein